jgi:hypothetical protein
VIRAGVSKRMVRWLRRLGMGLNVRGKLRWNAATHFYGYEQQCLLLIALNACGCMPSQLSTYSGYHFSSLSCPGSAFSQLSSFCIENMFDSHLHTCLESLRPAYLAIYFVLHQAVFIGQHAHLHGGPRSWGLSRKFSKKRAMWLAHRFAKHCLLSNR